ncbi:MAG TPA: DNA repair protein RecO [Acidimicrobiales bacterium]|nr:DNA repair protein RecO [Acidimicrobiales bacterium]
MSLYSERGVVLRTIKLGEADRIITFMTLGRGKVRAVAKGVRRTKSRFGARLEPMVHVSLLLYEGRELDVVTQAESIDHFRALREDLDGVGRAAAMLEAVEQVAQERHADPRLYRMLVGALRALSETGSALVVPAFFLKLLALEGFAPVLERCASCGDGDVELIAFDLEQGGALCRSCRRGEGIDADTLALMGRILGGGLASVLAEDRPAGAGRIEAVASRAMEHHLERRLRSLRVLDRT